MDVKKNLIILVLSFALSAFSSPAWAKERNLRLQADRSHKTATGNAYLGKKGLSIHAKGLRPNAVYTVWFVNTKPKKHETGAGAPPYMFKTDGNGYGVYDSTLVGSPFGKWEMIMVVLHPDGDPTNMKSMVGALSARIPDTG